MNYQSLFENIFMKSPDIAGPTNAQNHNMMRETILLKTYENFLALFNNMSDIYPPSNIFIRSE